MFFIFTLFVNATAIHHIQKTTGVRDVDEAAISSFWNLEI